MPANPRTKLKKKVAWILNHWDKSLVALDELYDIFAEDHPDYAEMLAVIITNLLVNREFLLDFWAHAWGERPDDYSRWL